MILWPGPSTPATPLARSPCPAKASCRRCAVRLTVPPPSGGSGSYRVRHPSSTAMRQPFRLLVTGSRTWDDTAVIEHALTAILARHPEGVLLVHGACPPRSRRHRSGLRRPHTRLPHRGPPGGLAPSWPGGRAAAERRDGHARRAGLRRVPARRQPRHHGHYPAGPGRGHTRLGSHAAMTAEVTATPAFIKPTRLTLTTTNASWIMP